MINLLPDESIEFRVSLHPDGDEEINGRNVPDRYFISSGADFHNRHMNDFARWAVEDSYSMRVIPCLQQRDKIRMPFLHRHPLAPQRMD